MSVFQIVLVSTFGAVAVAGVLIFALAVGNNAASTVGDVEIWGTLDGTSFNTVIRQALEKDTRLSHVVYVQKDEDKFITELTNALASGTGPDLALIPHDYAYSQASKLIPIPAASLSTTQFENIFIEGANPFVLPATGIVAVPLAVDPLVLYWNKDLMGTAGYAKPPVYWDELQGIAHTVTAREADGSIEKSAIDFGEYRNVNNAKSIIGLLILQAGGEVTTYDQAGKLIPALSPKTGVVTQSTPSAIRFYTGFADPSQNDYTWSRSLPEARQAFAAGDLALYVGRASEAPTITRINPNLNYAIAPIPQIRGATAAVDTGTVYGFAVPRAAKNPTGAFTVAAILTAADVSQKLSIALGIPSARREVLALPAEGNDPLFNKQAIIVRNWVDPDPVQTNAIFQGMIENTTSGALLLSEAIQRADQELAHVLGI